MRKATVFLLGGIIASVLFWCSDAYAQVTINLNDFAQKMAQQRNIVNCGSIISGSVVVTNGYSNAVNFAGPYVVLDAGGLPVAEWPGPRKDRRANDATLGPGESRSYNFTINIPREDGDHHLVFGTARIFADILGNREAEHNIPEVTFLIECK